MAQTFQCEECDFRFTEKGSLTKHQQSVHIGKKYPCKECDYQAKWKSEHQQSVHMGKKYPCDECDYQAAHREEPSHHTSIVSPHG